MIQITSDKDVDVGDIGFREMPGIRGSYAKPPTSPPSLIGNLKPEQIVDIRAAAGFGWRVDRARRTSETRSQWLWNEWLRRIPTMLVGTVTRQARGVEASLRGIVQRINESRGICRWRSQRDSRCSLMIQELTPDQIKDEVRKVWVGIFNYLTCQIEWAEGTFWNIQATVEYEDGRKSSILTDGGHVQVQDREGKYWYMRDIGQRWIELSGKDPHQGQRSVPQSKWVH